MWLTAPTDNIFKRFGRLMVNSKYKPFFIG